MKETIYNYDYLKDEDITEVVIRTKALIINNKNILLGNEDNIYQFPGGHLEDNETFEECLKREVLDMASAASYPPKDIPITANLSLSIDALVKAVFTLASKERI